MQLFCIFFAIHLHITKLLFSIASLNRDTMNELIILFYFLLAMIPVLIVTRIFENIIKKHDDK